jgi:glycosyltransferase involved in cell wall biosynthesis
MSHVSCPITVVHVIDDLGLGGAQRQLVELIKALPKDRYAVHVIALSTTKVAYESILRRAGISLTLIPHAGTWSWRTLMALVRQRRGLRPDIVQTWLFTADLYGRLAAFIVRVPRVVCAIRNAIEDMPWHYRLVNWLLSGGTACITVNADAIRPGLIRRGGIPARKIRVIPNGLNLGGFPPVARNGIYHQEWGIPPEAKIVAMVARFAPQKDHWTFLQAAARVSQHIPDAYFVLVGEGALRATVQRWVEELGLTKRVRVVGARSDVWQLLHHLEVFVLATHHEGSPNVVMEAMAAERPVVATNVDGAAELVVSGETGWLVPRKDVEAMAEAIERLLKHPDQAKTMGARGRARIEQHFSIEQTVRKTMALYEELTGHNESSEFGMRSAE